MQADSTQPRQPTTIGGRHTERVSRSSVFIPLFVVIGALVALVFVPPMITEQTRLLRHEVQQVHAPLTGLVSSLERATGAELAAARGYALTGDPFFVDRFLAVHAYGNDLALELDSLAAQVGGPVQVASTRLLATREGWTRANVGRTRADFRVGLAEHQQYFDAVMAAAQRLREAAAVEVERQNQRIMRAEQARVWATSLLALVALLGAASAVWLAHRLHRKESELVAAWRDLRAMNETLEERVRDRTLRLRQLSRELTIAEQRERRQIAQLLHDDLQQLLFAVQLGLEGLRRRVGRISEEAVADDIQDIGTVIGEALAATRRLTVDLSPPVKAGEQLGEALQWLAAHVQERFGLEVEVQAPEHLCVPADELRLLVFQIIRELLFNVVKHAGATRATVRGFRDDGWLIIEVEDHGRGFDPAVIQAEAPAMGGFGLRHARERIELFGGRIEIDSSPEAGTRARVIIPSEHLEPVG